MIRELIGRGSRLRSSPTSLIKKEKPLDNILVNQSKEKVPDLQMGDNSYLKKVGAEDKTQTCTGLILPVFVSSIPFVLLVLIRTGTFVIL